MTTSYNFMVAGSLFLLVGVGMGMYMAASGEHALAPAHAHINLLGFTLMIIFGLVYRLVPAMGETALARVHFWLHLVGSVLLTLMLTLLLSGRITEAAMVPAAPIAELLVLAGALSFVWLLFTRGR